MNDESINMADDSTRTTSPPSRFTCPLTMGVMRFPLQHKPTGNHFEREAIMNWLYRGNATCPLTRKPIHPSEFELNTALQMEIQKWHHMRGMDMSSATISQSMDDSELDIAFDDILAIAQNVAESARRIRENRSADAQPRSRGPPVQSVSVVSTVEAPVSPLDSTKDRISALRDRVLNKREEKWGQLQAQPKSLASVISIRDRVMNQREARLQSVAATIE